jgi:hypothetical protein
MSEFTEVMKCRPESEKGGMYGEMYTEMYNKHLADLSAV